MPRLGPMSPTATPPAEPQAVPVHITGSWKALAAAGTSMGYTFAKDGLTCYFDMGTESKYLEEFIKTVIRNVREMQRRKDSFDQDLELSVSRTKNAEYKDLETWIKNTEETIKKLVGEHFELVDENGINLDSSSANDWMSDAVKGKLKIKFTTKLLLTVKQADLKNKLSQLNDDATEILKKLQQKDILTSKNEAKDHQDDQHEATNHDWTEKYVDQVLRYLESKRVVGIAGPMGSGKEVIKMLHKRLSSNNPQFHPSILIESELMEKDNVLTLQKEIMERLEMSKMDITRNVDTNKKNIAKFLEKKEYIVLMDDVYSFIGIKKSVFPEQNKVKVVIASSSKKVAGVETDYVVEIKKLSKEESKDLFGSTHGPIDSDRKKKFFETIVECCGGVPEVIIHIAKSLKGMDDTSWEYTKDSLRGDTSNEHLGLAAISSMFISQYEKLEDQVKKCLLYEALFPPEKGLHKDYLTECWIAEEFIDADNGFRSCRNEGDQVLHTLTKEYLLIHSRDDDRFVMMPPYFRRVALKLSGEDNHVIWRPKKHDIWKKAKRISLIKWKTNLPQRPQCKKLRTLLMQHHQLENESNQLSDDFFGNMMQHHQLENESNQLSDDFFGNMKELRMLDFEETKTMKLPETIGELKSLRCLYLTKCRALTHLPKTFSNLKMLQLLDIFETGIGSIPKEIGGLANLRCLRVTLKGNVEGEIVPANIIGGLKKLEELSIGIDKLFKDWKNRVPERVVDEMATLEHLNSLRYNFPNMDSLIKFASSSKSLKNEEKKDVSFTSFQISVDSCERMAKYPQTINERRLSIYRVDKFPEPTTAIILKQANCLELIDAQKVKCLNGMALEGVEVCLIRGCGKLECIIDGDIALECIRKLHLYNLESLQHIWNGQGQLSSKSLKLLAEIKLHDCPELETILNHELVNALIELKYLEVKNCRKVSHVLEVRSPQDAECKILNKLETLVLSDMPELKSICITPLKWESLRGLDIRKCAKLMDLKTLKEARRLKISCEASWKAVVMQKQENNWLLDDKRVKFNFIDESSAVRADHGAEASTSGGTLNPSSVLPDTNEISVRAHNGTEASTSRGALNLNPVLGNTNEISSVSDDGEGETISANGNGEYSSSSDKQELFVGTSGAGSSSQQKANNQDFTAIAISADVPAQGKPRVSSWHVFSRILNPIRKRQSN